MQREIVLDTETTGLDPAQGHRVVELGAVELVNHLPTGRTFHAYLNPERDMPEEAFRVHGLSAEFLADHPVFAEVVDAFLEFLGDGKLVIHNAAFDVRFLNAELAAAPARLIPSERAVDTLLLAQRTLPGCFQQPRRALQALRGRQLQPQAARRAARLRAAGRRLPPPPRRPSGRPRPRPADARLGRSGRDPHRPPPPAARAEPRGAGGARGVRGEAGGRALEPLTACLSRDRHAVPIRPRSWHNIGR